MIISPDVEKYLTKKKTIYFHDKKHNKLGIELSQSAKGHL